MVNGDNGGSGLTASRPEGRKSSSVGVAAPSRPGTFVYAEPVEGSVFLWESWLHHEVMPNAAKRDRISISFNYR